MPEEKQLTHGCEFEVKSVTNIIQTYKIRNNTMGGSNTSVIGTRPEVHISVRTEDEKIPVKGVKFYGYIHLEAEDRIKAYLPIYSTRGMEVTEIATKIEKLGEDGRVLVVAEGLEGKLKDG